MACCAMPGGCGNPTCYLCTVIAKLPQQIELKKQAKEKANKAKDKRDG